MTMQPPKNPLFDGRSVSASEEDGFIGFRPMKGHLLSSPPHTTTLSLRAARIIRVDVEPLEHPGHVSLRFHGDFSEGSLPDDVVLAPVTDDDATALVAVLAEHLGLPRRPKPVQRYELIPTAHHRIEDDAYITVVGAQMPPGHFEGPDFEGIRLTGDRDRIAGRIPGKRYLVTGFYEAGSSGRDARVVGYSGPSIRVMTISPEPTGQPRAGARWWSPPRSPSTRGSVLVLLHPTENHGHDQLEFSTRPDPATLVVGAIDAMGGQRSGSIGARLAQLTLATVLEEPAYAPLLGPPIEPPALVFDDLAAWAAWLVDRRPLPRAPDALVTALGNRIGAVLEGVNLRGCCLAAGGILAVVRAGRATLLRRGVARAYLLREGNLRPLLHEHILGREFVLTAEPELSAWMAGHYWVPCSIFTPVDAKADTPPLEIEVQRGDRLIFVAGAELLRALEDPARERLLTAPLPDVVAGMPPTEDMTSEGWCVVAVDVDAH